jgi:hypothetical protein
MKLLPRWLMRFTQIYFNSLLKEASRLNKQLKSNASKVDPI